MAKLILNGDISGLATIQAPPVAGTGTFTLPEKSGNLLAATDILKSSANAVTSKIAIEINGTTYYLLATTSAS